MRSIKKVALIFTAVVLNVAVAKADLNSDQNSQFEKNERLNTCYELYMINEDYSKAKFVRGFLAMSILMAAAPPLGFGSLASLGYTAVSATVGFSVADLDDVGYWPLSKDIYLIESIVDADGVSFRDIARSINRERAEIEANYDEASVGEKVEFFFANMIGSRVKKYVTEKEVREEFVKAWENGEFCQSSNEVYQTYFNMVATSMAAEERRQNEPVEGLEFNRLSESELAARVSEYHSLSANAVLYDVAPLSRDQFDEIKDQVIERFKEKKFAKQN